MLFNLPLVSCDGPRAACRLRALRIPELEKVGLRHLILYQSALPGLAGRAAPADSGTPFRHHNREDNEKPALRWEGHRRHLGFWKSTHLPPGQLGGKKQFSGVLRGGRPNWRVPDLHLQNGRKSEWNAGVSVPERIENQVGRFPITCPVELRTVQCSESE